MHRPQSLGVWLMPVGVAVVCAVIYLSTAAYGPVSGDVLGSNLLSWQLATTGSSTYVDGTYPPLDAHPLRDAWIADSSDGREVIGRLPGAVIAAIPAYWAFGGSDFSTVPGGATAALLSAISVLLFALTVRDRLRAREAALASLIFGLSTPVWSVAADGMWTHTITVLGLCGMAWAANSNRWWLVGLFGGVAIWGRLHVAVIVAVVGVLVGATRRDPWIVVKVGLSSGTLLALQCVWTEFVYGSWNPTSAYGIALGDDPFTTEGLGIVNQLGFWVSPDRGLLVWSPILLLLLPPLVRKWRQLPDWSTALVWGGLLYLVVQGMRSGFAGGDSFYGYRLTLELVACAAPALAFSAHAMGSWARNIFGPVLVFQTLVISVGAIDGRVASPAQAAWTRHTLLSALANYPVLLVGFLFTSAAIGVLLQRIWANPQLRSTRVAGEGHRVDQVAEHR
jgi:alpha-1,2-mannosyltransferase